MRVIPLELRPDPANSGSKRRELWRGLTRPGTSNRSDATIKWPRRPDDTVLSESIPLFYVGQDKHGFWVAREAQGRGGGLFLFQRSAVRFARNKSSSAGCAMMIVAEPLELDLENQGSRFVESLAAAVNVIARRAPAFATFIGMAVAEWRKLIAEISRAVAGERRNRAAIERELFHGQYTLSSKFDDELPIP
jgi:hypothetical protein